MYAVTLSDCLTALEVRDEDPRLLEAREDLRLLIEYALVTSANKLIRILLSETSAVTRHVFGVYS